MAHSTKPDSISIIGFANAPTTKLLMLVTGGTSITFSFLSRRYRTLSLLSWPHVCSEKQVWRLLTSQIIIDSSITDLISNCYLMYSFVVLERRWGSAKFISFLISSWSLSLSMYYGIYKSNLLESSIPNIQTVPSGLYGPLFAMLVYYTLDVRQENDASSRRLNIPFTNKLFVYLIMLQMVISLDKPEKVLISLCGIMSGILHRMNFLNIQKLFIMPEWLRRGTKSLFTFIGLLDNSEEIVSRGVMMGATPEIHDDMVYDYITKKQQRMRRFQVPNLPGDQDRNREQVGQGYSEVMNPAFPDLFDGVRRRHQQAPLVPPNPPQEATSQNLDTESVPEEKVQTLIDMGFERDAVLNALASTANDVQQATMILISAANEE